MRRLAASDAAVPMAGGTSVQRRLLSPLSSPALLSQTVPLARTAVVRICLSAGLLLVRYVARKKCRIFWKKKLSDKNDPKYALSHHWTNTIYTPDTLHEERPPAVTYPGRTWHLMCCTLSDSSGRRGDR